MRGTRKLKLPKLEHLGIGLLLLWTIFVLCVALFPIVLLFGFILFGNTYPDELVLRGLLALGVSFLLVPFTFFIYEEFV